MAISDGETVVAAMTIAGRDRPSDQLMPCVERCLQMAGWTAADLEGLAVSAGPGSFTGIRVGVTAAKTLAYTLKKPIVPVSSLDVLAANVPAPRWPLWVIVDARKEKLYAARYELPMNGLLHRAGRELLVALEQLLPQMTGEVAVLGDGLVRYGEAIRAALGERGHYLPEALWVPQASAVCRLGARAFADGGAVELHALNPHYLYSNESDITGW